MLRHLAAYLPLLVLLCTPASADSTRQLTLPMWQQGIGGYYVRGTFGGIVESEMLVDTGSSYVVLSRDTFTKLKRGGAAFYERTIHGTTATGRVTDAKVYVVSELALGDTCVLHGVEVVVLPGANRDILGLSALRRLQPFALQLEPATLSVSGCSSTDRIAALPGASDDSTGG